MILSTRERVCPDGVEVLVGLQSPPRARSAMLVVLMGLQSPSRWRKSTRNHSGALGAHLKATGAGTARRDADALRPEPVIGATRSGAMQLDCRRPKAGGKAGVPLRSGKDGTPRRVCNPAQAGWMRLHGQAWQQQQER